MIAIIKRHHYGVMRIVDYETKKNSLFIEAVVYVNGESDPEMYKDSQDDVWDSKTIKQIKTTQGNQIHCDIDHNKVKIEGIETIDTYQNKTVETIGGRDVPVGSLRRDYMVSDDEVIQMIKNNEINGISPNNILEPSTTCAKELKNIEGNIYYNSDIENKECMIPIFDSFVGEPANGYGLNVYSYDKYLEKSKNPRGGKLSNKVKEMLKGFGDSLRGFADEIDNIDESSEVEETEEETVVEETTETKEQSTDGNLEETVSELKKSVEKQEKEIAELKKSGDVVKEEDSIDDVKADVRKAIIEKDFSDVEYPDVWDVLFADDCMIVKDYDNNTYLKYDYSVSDDGSVSIGDSSEVELQYATKGAETETEEETEDTTSTDTTTAESQKSKQPKIKVENEKSDNVEMEKQSDVKVNHLGMPIKSTKDLAKNQFNF